MKMSKSEPINSALEDENNGTEESETLDDEYLSDLSDKAAILHVQTLCFKRVCERKLLGKIIISFRRRH